MLPQHVGARDDAKQLTLIVHNRQPADGPRDEELLELVERHVRRDRWHLPTHPRFDPLRCLARLCRLHDVLVLERADEFPAFVNHRHALEVRVDHLAPRVLHGFVRAERNDRFRHNIARRHLLRHLCEQRLHCFIHRAERARAAVGRALLVRFESDGCGRRRRMAAAVPLAHHRRQIDRQRARAAAADEREKLRSFASLVRDTEQHAVEAA
mmetsp:Transcript_18292/g.39458  ORF Transcript_18292/g.39458 Transcript_18292/m.39458 type:complete len:211 (+) Transcript_18292:1472-2104(+)